MVEQKYLEKVFKKGFKVSVALTTYVPLFRHTQVEHYFLEGMIGVKNIICS